jgi:hypothetical protein
MSYLTLSNHDEYYDSTNQGQTMNNSYGDSRQQNSDSGYGAQSSYSGEFGQNQYSLSGYDWSNGQQQEYDDDSRQRIGYGNEGWTGVNSQNASTDSRAQAGNCATQAAAGNTSQNYYNGTRSARQSNTGSNNPANASGLDNASVQRHSQRSSAPSAPAYTSAASALGNNRVQLPLATQNPSHHNTTPSTYGYQNASQGGDELSAAAAALARAVSARFQQASASSGGRPVSHVMEQSKKTASPYYQQSTQQARGQAQQQNYRASNTVSNDQRQQPAEFTQHGRGSTQNATRTSQTQATPVNSISNLVTRTVEEPARVQCSTSMDTNSMPSFIDPTQVFNSYATEHERRRREAAAQAEAEACDKAQDEATAKMANEKEAAAEKKRIEEAAAAKKREQEVGAATTKANNSKKRTPTFSTNSMPQSPPTPAALASSGGEPDMAAELKSMMEKMKEFRNKDPSLFQKLWDDMRKPGSAAIQSPSPQITRQSLPTGQAQQNHASLTVQQFDTPQAGSDKKRKRRTEPPNVPYGARANGFNVVVENNEEGLPDLGRFPAERRIRPKAYHPRESHTPTESPAPVPSIPAVIPLPQHSIIAMPSVPALEPPRPGPVVTQPLPPRTASGGTIWPEEKRNTVAEAAVKTLTSIPENAGIVVTAVDIHAMLAQNPSYVELCELLEKKGLKFHRGHFARQLLTNVPYLNGRAAESPATPAAAKPSPPVVVPPQATITSALQPPAPGVPPDTMPIMTGPPPPLPQRARPCQPNGVSPSPVVKPEKAMQASQYPAARRPGPGRPPLGTRPEPPLGSKEAQSRKRDFSELVDLTVLSDNENYVSAKQTGPPSSPSPEPQDPFQQFSDAVAAVRTTIPQPGHSVYMQNGGALRFDPTQRQYPQSAQGYTPLPHYSHQLTTVVPTQAAPATRVPAPRYHAKGVNQEEALRKTYYDAKTVARDLLIAAGRHPTERPLNAHMAGMLGKHVDIDSDLSTFDWDTVDPGGPPMPQVAFADVPMNPPRFRIGEIVHRRSKLNESMSTESKPVSDAETENKTDDTNEKGKGWKGKERESRLPEEDKGERPTPALRRPGRPRLGKFDLGHREPSRAAPPASLVQLDTGVRPSHLRRSDKAEVFLTSNSVVPQKRRPSVVISPRTCPTSDRKRSTRSASIQVTPFAEPSAKRTKMEEVRTFSSGKRIGRPPGAKNRQPTIGAMRRAAARQLGQEETPKPASPATTSSMPVFKCRWKGCHAQLHNLDTLRNHVSKVHRPTTEQLKDQPGYICWWKKCELLQQDEEGNFAPTKIFIARQEWTEHIETSHIYAVARKFGDGPTTKYTGEDKSAITASNARASFPFDISQFSFHPNTYPSSSSKETQAARTPSHTDPQTLQTAKTSYLSDTHNRAVTPDVSLLSIQPDLPPDTMTLTKAHHDPIEEQALKSFMKTHRVDDKSGGASMRTSMSAKAIAEETLKAMSARKAKIGPGIDRGGCILVTEERRQTFVQNPKIRKVVDAGY